jgi:hypothetical protein
MRRIVVVVLLAAFMVVPAANLSASTCPDVSGSAKLDTQSTLGSAKLIYDGNKIKVDFVETSFTPTGPNTADVTFDWYFPGGTVTLIEHSTTTPINGPLVAFDSTIEIVAGGSGSWTWVGVFNAANGKARFDLEGSLCIGS